MTSLAELLPRISYKPGWTLRVGQRDGRDWLLIDVATRDARNPENGWRLPAGRRIDRGVQAMDEEQLLAWVLGLIDDIERHERDEWFRLDGKPVHDPHAPKETT